MPVVIENPIINSPFVEPTCHYHFDDAGRITDEIRPQRRVSSYTVPIAKTRKQGAVKQIAFEVQERKQENKLINEIRIRVGQWRKQGYPGITAMTRRLLNYWQNPEREKRLFFCQIEAMETIIYLTEVAERQGNQWLINDLHKANANSSLYRLAFKMATGSGKTVVMAMLIVWHTFNKQADLRNKLFSDAFLIVTPGITIRDRLRVLYPSDPDNYYQKMDLVPPNTPLGTFKIVITNWHAFKSRDLTDGSAFTKQVLTRGGEDHLLETPAQMVNRVCRSLGSKRKIVVINDEAHHCYRRNPEAKDKISAEVRKEVEELNKQAEVWLSGLEAVKEKLGIRVTYDLSATPFYLQGSGYSEGTIFPWVISDFSLLDAIESGIVKIPRTPVDDNSLHPDSPTYRYIWQHIREELPTKKDSEAQKTHVPQTLQGALHSLYSNYEKRYRAFQVDYQAWQARPLQLTEPPKPPVFIVVCNNTTTSQLIYRYIAGWEKQFSAEKTLFEPGKLSLFSNFTEDGKPLARPNTFLIDSQQLESEEAMNKEFKQLAQAEIAAFKEECRQRFQGRNVDDLTDEDLLREVMNTVGKPGKLGEHIRCVVSVSMLTEGWDVNTVTHILGVRAFGTQLLCEQVIGRGLRRMSYASEEDRFEPEYVEVYGIPFAFLPTSGHAPDPKATKRSMRIRALPARAAATITFPNLVGYHFRFPEEELTTNFSPASRLTLTTQDLPTSTEIAPLIGKTEFHTLEDFERQREQQVAFNLAKEVLKKFPSDPGQADPFAPGDSPKFWLFDQVLQITKAWMRQYLSCTDGTVKPHVLLEKNCLKAIDLIYQAIVIVKKEQIKTFIPTFRASNPSGSTANIDFETVREVYETSAAKCHVPFLTLESKWEHKMAQTLDQMPEVVRYIKNQGLGFTIPYAFEGQSHQYFPDFLAQIDDGHGPADLLTVIIEVTGQQRAAKKFKVDTARNLWLPAVNNHGGFGRWAFLEVLDPFNLQRPLQRLSAGEAGADEL